jgi:hypothetical protein
MEPTTIIEAGRKVRRALASPAQNFPYASLYEKQNLCYGFS